MTESDLTKIEDYVINSHSMVKVLRVYSEFNENYFTTIEMLPILENIENKLKKVIDLF